MRQMVLQCLEELSFSLQPLRQGSLYSRSQQASGEGFLRPYLSQILVVP